MRRDVEVYPQITFEVAFGEGEILKGEPILTTLNQFANVVDGIVEAFTTAGLLT